MSLSGVCVVCCAQHTAHTPLLVSELYRYQNAWCYNENYVSTYCMPSRQINFALILTKNFDMNLNLCLL
jgi:hypothetical protein